MDSDIFIEVEDVIYTYDLGTEYEETAVKGISFELRYGEYIAILGANGSGKSTLAKLLNALLLPQSGKVLLLGKSTEDSSVLDSIHSQVGMVFQNPDNQIVGTTVEEDVAFGPENIAIPRERMLKIVPASIKSVGLSGKENFAPAELSGGQKQKLAIAGILAMEPTCIILDEATSMLDPRSRKEVLTILRDLQKDRNLSIINVTHHMDELVDTDRVILISDGKLQFTGKVGELFLNDDLLERFSMAKPDYISVTEKVFKVFKETIYPDNVKSPEAAAESVLNVLRRKTSSEISTALNICRQYSTLSLNKRKYYSENEYFTEKLKDKEVIIKAENLSYNYDPDDKHSSEAIHDISFEIFKGEFIGICGSTGSGKSTLVQHLNALLKLQKGNLEVCDYNLKNKKEIADLRKYIGMVMQYPEDQLFAESIYEDIAFGPKQMGMSSSEIDKNVKQAIKYLGIENLDLNRSPFSLSGGQMRRVAIAGILAMHPEILVLDEPAAGLDPQARDDLYDLLKNLQAAGTTIIMISHSMEDISKLCDRVMVMQKGEVIDFAPVKDIFTRQDFLSDGELDVPILISFAKLLGQNLTSLDTVVFNVDDLVENILESAAWESHSGEKF